MNRRRNKVLGAVVVFAAVAIIGSHVIGASYPQEHNHGGHQALGQKPQATKPGPPSLEMIHSKQLPAIQEAIKQAIAHVEAGHKSAALAQLKRAQLSLKLVHQGVGMHVKPKFVNSKCPIMGAPINPDKVTATLTRTYKNQKVAFCCGGCPAAWDGLTSAQKDAKLKPVLVKTSEPHSHQEHSGHVH